jgi:hypothetical protein
MALGLFDTYGEIGTRPIRRSVAHVRVLGQDQWRVN